MISPRKTLVVGLFVAAVLFVGGAGYVFSQVQTAESTATTEATIQTASVESSKPVSRPFTFGNIQYRANITYTYVVGGARHTSHSVFPGNYAASSTEKPIANVANEYQQGDQVTVHYSTSDPDSSYLIERYTFFPGFLAMVIAPFVAAYVLTPGFAWVTLFGALVRQSLFSSEKFADGNTGTSGGNEWNDPVPLTDDATERTEAPEHDSLYLTGQMEWAAWVGATVVSLAVVALYLTLSAPSYNQLAYFVALMAVAVTVARAGFRYQFS